MGPFTRRMAPAVCATALVALVVAGLGTGRGQAQVAGGQHARLLAARTVSAAGALQSGYDEVAANGQVFNFGGAPADGSMAARPLADPVVGMAADPATGGYWLVAADGGVFAFTAPFHGSMGGQHLNSPIVGMAGTSNGGGYWLVAADGGIFAFGDASYSGSEGGGAPGSRIVGLAAAKDADTQVVTTYTAASGLVGNGTGADATGTGSGTDGGGTGGGGTGGGTHGGTGGGTHGGTGGGTHGGTGGGTHGGICGSSELEGPATPPKGAVTLPAGDDSDMTATWQLSPDKTYWLAPGVHTLGTGEFAQFQPDTGDTFMGAPGAVVDGQDQNQSAFDSTNPDVTVEYLTIENFTGGDGQMVVNHGGGVDWTVEDDTVEHNGGAGVGLASGSVVDDNCLTDNQEYGFASFGGSTDVTLSGNEISLNDSTGAYDHGTGTIQCGCSGGGKFWDTTDAVVTDNVVVTNGNVGIWVDTDNAGFDITDNYIAHNYAEGIIYEISYNALISDNTFVGNAVGAGPTLGFPDSAVYISESGGDARVHSDYAGELEITDNVFTNNWGGVVLWANSNRYCGDGYDQYCTLVTPSTYTLTSCPAHMKGAKANQTPDYYDNCLWKTQNVTVSHNTFSFNPSAVGAACENSSDCGYNGLFSQYGTTTPWKAFTVPLHISDDQDNHFSDNVYNGPWKFQAFTLGQVATWTQWTKGFTYPFTHLKFDAQDAGSTYDPTPPTDFGQKE